MTSPAALQALLGLSLKQRVTTNGGEGDPSFSLFAHSSSIAARSTSAISPRTFVFTPPADVSGVQIRSPLPDAPNPE